MMQKQNTPAQVALKIICRCRGNYFIKILFFPCIDGIPEDIKPVVQEFQSQVTDHIQGRHQIFVPMERIGQVAASDGGDGREHAVEGEDLQHGHRHVAGGLEGVPAV